MKHIKTDGGYSESGCPRASGDCATRSISIFTEIPYKEIWRELTIRKKKYYATFNLNKALRTDARESMPVNVSDNFVGELGFIKISTEHGSVHLNDFENRKGTFLVRIRRHITVIINGVIHDSYNCANQSSRKTQVLAYWEG